MWIFATVIILSLFIAVFFSNMILTLLIYIANFICFYCLVGCFIRNFVVCTYRHHWRVQAALIRLDRLKFHLVRFTRRNTSFWHKSSLSFRKRLCSFPVACVWHQMSFAPKRSLQNFSQQHWLPVRPNGKRSVSNLQMVEGFPLVFSHQNDGRRCIQETFLSKT